MVLAPLTGGFLQGIIKPYLRVVKVVPEAKKAQR